MIGFTFLLGKFLGERHFVSPVSDDCIWLIMPSPLLCQQFSREIIFPRCVLFTVLFPISPNVHEKQDPGISTLRSAGHKGQRVRSVSWVSSWLTRWGRPVCCTLSPACAPKGGRQGVKSRRSGRGSERPWSPWLRELCCSGQIRAAV